MTDKTILAAYASLFSGWQANVLGPKPTADQLAKIEGLGLRSGKQALAIAMSLRDIGVTGKQIVIACGAPQLNRMRGLIAEGLLKRQVVSANGEGHTVYKNTVTAKGESEIKRIAKVRANGTATTEAPLAKAKRAKRVAKAMNDAKAAAGDPVQIAKLAQPATVADPLELPASLKRKPQAPQANA